MVSTGSTTAFSATPSSGEEATEKVPITAFLSIFSVTLFKNYRKRTLKILRSEVFQWPQRGAPATPPFFDKTPEKCHFDTFAKIVKMLFFEHEYIGSVVPSWRRKNSWKRN